MHLSPHFQYFSFLYFKKDIDNKFKISGCISEQLIYIVLCHKINDNGHTQFFQDVFVENQHSNKSRKRDQVVKAYAEVNLKQFFKCIKSKKEMQCSMARETIQ